MFDHMQKIVGSSDVGHAQFQRKLFVRPLGIPDTKPHKANSFVSFKRFMKAVLFSRY